MADLIKFKEEALTFKKHFLEKHSITNSVQDMWDDIKSIPMGALDACVLSKISSTRNNQPWITRELKQLTRRKKIVFKKAKKTQKAKDTMHY